MITAGRAETANEISRQDKNNPNKNATKVPKLIAIPANDNKVPRTDFSLETWWKEKKCKNFYLKLNQSNKSPDFANIHRRGCIFQSKYKTE